MYNFIFEEALDNADSFETNSQNVEADTSLFGIIDKDGD